VEDGIDEEDAHGSLDDMDRICIGNDADIDKDVDVDEVDDFDANGAEVN
jgi:hypothetical protein